jgi:hypothetical protein
MPALALGCGLRGIKHTSVYVNRGGRALNVPHTIASNTTLTVVMVACVAVRGVVVSCTARVCVLFAVVMVMLRKIKTPTAALSGEKRSVDIRWSH